MSVTGTGTQSDPYIVHSWKEYISVASASNSQCSYIEFDPNAANRTIDMDAEYPEKIRSTINIRDRVNFNGWELTKFSFINTNRAFTIAENGRMYNGAFTNINMVGVPNAGLMSMTLNKVGEAQIRDCQFNGTISNESATNLIYEASFGGNGYIDSISVVLDLLVSSKSSPSTIISTNASDGCKIQGLGLHNSYFEINTNGGIEVNFKAVSNSIAEGNLVKIKSDNVTASQYQYNTNQNLLILSDYTPKGTDSPTNVASLAGYYLKAGGWFIGMTDDCTRYYIPESYSSDLVLLNESQLKDTAYLKSKGFAIAEG